MEGIQYGIQQGYNPMTTAAYATQPYGSQFGQGFNLGNPLSGLLGSGIPGLLSPQNIGRQPGQGVDSFGGMFQSYGNPYGNIDPMTAAHIQQTQLAQLAQQRGLFGQQAHQAPWLGMNPLNRIDPITVAYVQQQIAQLCQQLLLQGQIGQQLGHGQFGQGQFGQSPFGQGQLGQGQPGQGWPGGGQTPWANPQLGSTFGRNVPFQSGPFQGVPLQYGAGGGYGSQLPTY